MIGALTSQSFQYLEARRYKTKNNNEQGTYFRYEELNDQNSFFGTVINNLIADQSRYVIKTNWDIGFEVGDFIVDKKNGNMWTIEQIERLQHDTNSQVMFWLKKNPETDFVLSLVKIENAWGLNA